MVNTQLLHVPNVHTQYRKYFRGFLNSRLLSFARNPRKLMYREYYHVYSIMKFVLCVCVCVLGGGGSVLVPVARNLLGQ